ncbi:FtsB family cell division protein [Bacteroidetes bacterium endosymbiont of Geopemphigus sp.]|uniref:FtsB family cell division protein n=1 Tax=Bacteroidetes bacterium endosymbiont of Geopemphigus sp. TaxID=2047937 RepID=UPI000CD0787F|nr:septum formation initiator family protein [Bacteroidetes bacterium endosymbiont of Geopemphigus sp.]
MLFFDTNSLLVNYKLYKESDKIQKKLRYLKSQIAIEKNWLEKAKSDPDHMEKFAREKFYMKHPQEDVFIVSQKEEFSESDSNTSPDR